MANNLNSSLSFLSVSRKVFAVMQINLCFIIRRMSLIRCIYKVLWKNQPFFISISFFCITFRLWVCVCWWMSIADFLGIFTFFVCRTLFIFIICFLLFFVMIFLLFFPLIHLWNFNYWDCARVFYKLLSQTK